MHMCSIVTLYRCTLFSMVQYKICLATLVHYHSLNHLNPKHPVSTYSYISFTTTEVYNSIVAKSA